MGWNYLSIPKLQQLHRWSLGMNASHHPTLYWTCHYLSMLGFKLIHINKGSPVMFVWRDSEVGVRCGAIASTNTHSGKHFSYISNIFIQGNAILSRPKINKRHYTCLIADFTLKLRNTITQTNWECKGQIISTLKKHDVCINVSPGACVLN